jgi:hypothetical protein
MSKREKAFPLTGRETAKTEFLGRKKCSHRQAPKAPKAPKEKAFPQTDRQEKICQRRKSVPTDRQRDYKN